MIKIKPLIYICIWFIIRNHDERKLKNFISINPRRSDRIVCASKPQTWKYDLISYNCLLYFRNKTGKGNTWKIPLFLSLRKKKSTKRGRLPSSVTHMYSVTSYYHVRMNVSNYLENFLNEIKPFFFYTCECVGLL